MRYFIEVAYHGKAYAGFQIQENAHTVQAEVENALYTLLRQSISLTGSSRTDAGVHALSNYFHFDSDAVLGQKQVYNLNAILPDTIAVKRIVAMHAEAHSRFDAIGRSYAYTLSLHKNPFATDRAWHYPYPLNASTLQQAADRLLLQTDFTSFSKRNTQTKTMLCTLSQSIWQQQHQQWVYRVTGNRFLRGMVRALVATMLQVGRGRITLQQFEEIILAKDCTRADFSAPAHGLCLEQVIYPENYGNL
ncbi:MAG: tRNA pseudouridine(38-40) synthase TruA [Chitinophagaceae bacterium]|nr:tRNA pseudouridine(38-40) synthase TruA [Chitinophagaceae bacterium]